MLDEPPKDASKRLFTIFLAVPTLALLLGILTYNPTNDELAQEQERKAEQLRRLRGGSTTPANFGRWLLDAALASPVYKLLLVPQAKATMVKTAEDNGVPWRKALAWVREQGPWDLSPDEEAQRLSVPEYYKQPFHAYEEGNLCCGIGGRDCLTCRRSTQLSCIRCGRRVGLPRCV